MADSDSKIPFRPRFDIGVIVRDCGCEPWIDNYGAPEEAYPWPVFDYSDSNSSEDQWRLDCYFKRTELAGKKILHIGAGNSSFAKAVAGKAAYIAAITLAEREVIEADRLDLPNYSVHRLNKHSLSFAHAFEPECFDYIVDNNLASFACCQRHFERYVLSISTMLAKDGAIVTHWLGMQWVLDAGVGDVEKAWLLDEEKLHTIATSFQLDVQREDDIFFLRHATYGEDLLS